MSTLSNTKEQDTKLERCVDSYPLTRLRCSTGPVTTTSTGPGPATATSTVDASGSTVDASGAQVPNLSEIQKQLHSKIAEAQAQAQAAQGQAKEGFDLIGTESRLKSGKQSNSISVNNKTKSSENVSPSEENIFSTSSYSKF